MKQCIVCKNTRLRLKYSSVSDYEYGTYHPVDYLQCPNCGTLTQDPLPSQEKVSTFYPVTYRNHHLFTKRGIYAILKHLQVRSLAKKLFDIKKDRNAKILEIGCGSGLLLKTLHTLGTTHLWGTDISDQAEKMLMGRGIQFQKENIDKRFPFREHFDLIILNNVLEHFYQPAFVLAQCKAHLSDGGKLVIITPNSDSLVMNMFGKYCDGVNAPRHTYIFSIRAMKIIKQTLGFHKISFYVNPDLMQWNLSLQNVLQNSSVLRSRLKNGLAWYTIFLSILFLPISILTSFWEKTTTMFCVLE